MTIINYARPCHSPRNLLSISGSIRHAAVQDRSGTRHLRPPIRPRILSHTTVILPFPAENHHPIADGLFSSSSCMKWNQPRPPLSSPTSPCQAVILFSSYSSTRVPPKIPSPRTTLVLLPLRLFHDMIANPKIREQTDTRPEAREFLSS